MPRGPKNASGEHRYEHKIPSRDEILAAMEQAGQPLKLEALAPGFGIRTEQHRRALEARMRAMVRDGQLLRNRADEYCLTGHLDVVTGKVLAHRDGFGFLRPDDGSDDLYLAAREMHLLWDGDRVAARTTETPRGREGHVVEILARGKTRIVGHFRRERGIDFVLESGESRTEVLIARGESHGAKPGDIVNVEVLEYPSKRNHAIGRVLEIVGRKDQIGIDTDVAILAHGIPNEWPAEAIAEARTWSAEVPEKAKEGREDLRSVPLVTIDGADAKDFDDAVFCEPQGDGWRLLVAIADVSYYVRPDSPLDREARGRGTSVYFPDRVVPMLPEELSNGLCSLNPNVERLAMVCEMAITPQGEVSRYEFYDAVIRSRARLTYTEVWNRLSGGKAPENLAVLYELFHALFAERTRRGAIDFDTLETRMVFDARGKIERIVPEKRNDAHRIIEECMLAANVCAGNFLASRKQPVLYRVHDVPAADRVAALREFLAELGLQLPGGEIPRPKDYAQLLERIRKRPDFGLLQTILLRSLKQAVYSPSNVGHFGLAFDAYVHFTSPIRRYPDLLVHRAIKAQLAGRQHAEEDWEALGRHCSETERRADDASRDVENWLKCYYMRDHVGGTFSGSITGVVPFGLFVTLDDYFVDGLVHISELGRDYFQFDAARHMLLGERTAKRFRLADRMTVKLVRVDLETRKIDFVPA